MHEMGIASSILEAVHKELQLYPGHWAEKVGVRIGAYAGVNAESLRFCFEVLAKSGDLQVPELEIHECAGDALDLAYIELQEVQDGTNHHREESPERERSHSGAVA
jgi:Zn finger protein HypA/HybF involved in hydrogenase expression